MGRHTWVSLLLCLAMFLVHARAVRPEPCDPENRYTDEALIPPDYETFIPPAAGQTYADPTFCTQIKRLTDSGNGYVTNSEIAYFNIDDSLYIASIDNTAYLMDGRDGRLLKAIGGGTMRPWWIRWPRANYYTTREGRVSFDPARHFYKYEGNELRLYSVDTLDYVVLRKFDEYSEIGPAGGEGDLSEDGRYWVLDGTRISNGVAELFAYDLLDDVKGPVCPLDLGAMGGHGPGVDYATISPSGRYVVIAWDASSADPFQGHYGVELFDRKTWQFLRRLHPQRIHFELGYDAFGREVFFSAAGNTPEEIAGFHIPDLSLGDQISVRLDDGVGRKLLDVPKYSGYVLGFPDGQQRYVFLAYHAIYRPDEPWKPYWGEILAVPTDGSQEAIRLVHHRSRPDEGERPGKGTNVCFNANNAGTRIVYQSTYGTGGADLYLFDFIKDTSTPRCDELGGSPCTEGQRCEGGRYEDSSDHGRFCCVGGTCEDETPGDLNGDGAVNVLDLQRMIDVILGQTPGDPSADLDQSGVVDVLDLQNLVGLILG